MEEESRHKTRDGHILVTRARDRWHPGPSQGGTSGQMESQWVRNGKQVVLYGPGLSGVWSNL